MTSINKDVNTTKKEDDLKLSKSLDYVVNHVEKGNNSMEKGNAYYKAHKNTRFASKKYEFLIKSRDSYVDAAYEFRKAQGLLSHISDSNISDLNSILNINKNLDKQELKAYRRVKSISERLFKSKYLRYNQYYGDYSLHLKNANKLMKEAKEDYIIYNQSIFDSGKYSAANAAIKNYNEAEDEFKTLKMMVKNISSYDKVIEKMNIRDIIDVQSLKTEQALINKLDKREEHAHIMYEKFVDELNNPKYDEYRDSYKAWKGWIR